MYEKYKDKAKYDDIVYRIDSSRDAPNVFDYITYDEYIYMWLYTLLTTKDEGRMREAVLDRLQKKFIGRNVTDYNEAVEKMIELYETLVPKQLGRIELESLGYLGTDPYSYFCKSQSN